MAAHRERLLTAIDALVESPRGRAITRSRWSGWAGSAILHGIVAISLLISWRHAHSESFVPYIPVELVTIGDETNIAPMVREQLPYPSADTPVAPAPPPAPPEAAPSLEMKIFPQKAQPSSQPDRKNFDPQGTNSNAPDRKPTNGPQNARIGDQDIKGVGDETGMTMTIIDALRNQIARCWHPIASSTSPEKLAVSYELYLDRDGSVSRPPALIGTSSGASAAEFQAEAETVRRAIYTCAPYSLPAAKYAAWRNLTLTFDPRMLPFDRKADPGSHGR
jgi:hypothetical protein